MITARGAVLTRPGAPSREGEAAATEDALAARFRNLRRIEAPGTVDGGDVCEAGEHFFISVSRRTNESGARQLARFLAADGYTSSLVDIRGSDEILHLKSGIALARREDARPDRQPRSRSGLRRLGPDRGLTRRGVRGELRPGQRRRLLRRGLPLLERALRDRGYRLRVLPVSEFQKMDGGLSCLSLRF